jgi:hypothetical protein
MSNKPNQTGGQEGMRDHISSPQEACRLNRFACLTVPLLLNFTAMFFASYPPGSYRAINLFMAIHFVFSILVSLFISSLAVLIFLKRHHEAEPEAKVAVELADRAETLQRQGCICMHMRAVA